MRIVKNLLFMMLVSFHVSATPLTDKIITSKFDGSTTEFAGAIGTSANGRVGFMVSKNAFSFVNLGNFICANSLDRKYRPEVRVKARYEKDGILLSHWDMKMPLKENRTAVLYTNWTGVNPWVRPARLADTLKVKIIDGCGEYILLKFDLRGSESELMKKWFPYKYERSCSKLTRKAEKLESRGGNSYAKAIRKQEVMCRNSGRGIK